jgi:hypothetical protein
MKKKLKKYQGDKGGSQVTPIQSKPSITPADTTSQKSTGIQKIMPATKPAAQGFYREAPKVTFKGKVIPSKKSGGPVKKKK